MHLSTFRIDADRKHDNSDFTYFARR